MSNNTVTLKLSEEETKIIKESTFTNGQTIEEWLEERVSKLVDTQKKVMVASKLRAHRGAIKSIVVDSKLMSLEGFCKTAHITNLVEEFGGYGKFVQLLSQGGCLISEGQVRDAIVAVNPAK